MRATRSEIRFVLNGEDISVARVSAGDTLLDFLRLRQRLTGTKEGCAEGDCGACTVLVGRLAGGVLVYEAVNACIRFLATVDGCHVVTIEHLRGADGGLHPVQRAMVAHHASQCGFCTPGIVMALYALWMRRPSPSVTEIEMALQGNLCRCTGYAPIIAAARSVGAEADPVQAERAEITARLTGMRDGARVTLGVGADQAVLPADVDDFGALLEEMPEATVVAGATDVGLWVTKQLREIGPALFIGHLGGLRQVVRTETEITLGAGVSYSEAEEAMTEAFPHLAAYWHRIAGWQVRNMGTIGGNIANGSPIGDMPPVLIALDARVILRRGAARRELPLDAFFIDYGKQDLRAGEFVEAIRVPFPAGDVRHGAWKVSKRRDEDISTVAAGIAVTVEGGRIVAARLAFGGMAGVPKRAAHAEAALIGEPFGEAAFRAALPELSKDFTPLSDHRASGEYRMTIARNLLLRFWAEQSGVEEAGLPERVDA
ncbi:MAG: xanthine dehydrogenase small subunit [Rhodobacterales bacterium]|nr:MAG: xanthine dehydrogenase small subunit [Rhodobacterales bacterium]